MAGKAAQNNAYTPATHRKVAYTGTAGTLGTDISDNINIIRVVVTTDAYVLVGDGTADANDMFMPANTPEYFVITPGQTVSAIQVSSGGTLHVTEMT